MKRGRKKTLTPRLPKEQLDVLLKSKHKVEPDKKTKAKRKRRKVAEEEIE